MRRAPSMAAGTSTNEGSGSLTLARRRKTSAARSSQQEHAMAIRFDDRVVIVTGAGGGLGRAHALGFAALGAKVVVNDLAVAGTSMSPAADAVVAEITAAGGTAIADGANVADRASVARLIERTMNVFGRIDVVVANAGILRDRSFAKMEESDWDAVLAVHMTGTYNVVRAAWPILRERGYGRIVTTSSSSGLFGNFGQANYAAAKMGLVGLTLTLAIEGAKYDIRANAVAPIAWTRMTAELFPPGSDALFAAEKVTPGVLFLASEGAPNGVVLAAGANAFAQAVVVETAPVMMTGPVASPDEIAARFGEIGALATATPLQNGALQTLKFLQKANGG
jgi:NAD(P)-dependent dehydrogenase (short-subunit alcohol dehydrogenase family)